MSSASSAAASSSSSPQQQRSSSGSITASLPYTTDILGKRVTVDLSANKKVDDGDPETTIMVRCEVQNARTLPDNENPKLPTQGFELVEQKTSLSTSDFYDVNFSKKSVYYDELSALICKVTGATKCFPFHHMIRIADPKKLAENSQLTAQGPAGIVHADYSRAASLNLYDQICPADIRGRGRFAVINAWRNIRDDHPIYDDALAMCDASSIVAPDDFIVQNFIDKAGKLSETYRLDAGHSSHHKWYYYPLQAKNEVLLFMQYDSDTSSRARYTFHTSMKDPHALIPCLHPRESIELRTMCFFPDHPVNTIPTQIMSGTDKIRQCCLRLISMVSNIHSWDADGKRWIQLTFYSGEDGCEKVVRHLLGKHVKSWFESRGGATGTGSDSILDQDSMEEIVAKTLSNGEFKRLIESQLSRPSQESEQIVKTAIESITNVVSSKVVREHWDSTGKQWLKNTMSGKTATDTVALTIIATGLVTNSAEKSGHHGLKDASAEIRNKVICGLVENPEFAKNCVSSCNL